MELRAGTSGFSYAAWKGSFYPEKLPGAAMLAFYASRLSTVEINSSFYRMPKRSVLEAWAAQVPESFRFAVKASRRITHFKRLQDAQEETRYLLGNLEALGERLGVLLFQLPPNLAADLPRLEAFLDLLPAELPAAMEFRHPSWQDEAVDGCLAGRGVARCVTDSSEVALPEALGPGPTAYLRLRRESYSDSELAGLAERLRDPAFERGYVFFKHEEAGAAALAAQRLQELARAPRAARRSRSDRREAG